MQPSSPDPAAGLSVLFASHTPETSVFRVGSHHLSRQLARMGLRVGHLSTPLSPMKLLGLGDRTGLRARWRTCLAGPTQDEDGRISAIPFTALPVQLTGAWPANAALRTALPSLRHTARFAGRSPFDFMLIDQPLFAGLQRLVPARKVVYRPTDVYLSRRLQGAQRRVLAESDAIVATSDRVLASLPAEAAQLPSLVLPNGVDAEAFSAQFDAVPTRSAVVYVGALDERTDWKWISELGRALPEVSIDLFGPVAARPNEALGTNVHLRGPVGYADLPQILSGYMVALMPFRAGEVNSGRSPMKLFEYLAAGLHVVATPHFALSQDPPPGVHIGADGATAAAAVRRLLAGGVRNAAGSQAADDEDWSNRAGTLLDFLSKI